MQRATPSRWICCSASDTARWSSAVVRRLRVASASQFEADSNAPSRCNCTRSGQSRCVSTPAASRTGYSARLERCSSSACSSRRCQSPWPSVGALPAHGRALAVNGPAASDCANAWSAAAIAAARPTPCAASATPTTTDTGSPCASAARSAAIAACASAPASLRDTASAKSEPLRRPSSALSSADGALPSVCASVRNT